MPEAKLPGSAMSVESLRNTLKLYATLDSILSPEWSYRYYSFDSKWDAGEEMGSMRNGLGDSFFAHFTKAGCFIKGFAHESVLSPWTNEYSTVWPGLLDSVPDEFSGSLKEPAFSMDETTFCVWRKFGQGSWQCGEYDLPNVDDPDGVQYLLADISIAMNSYCEYAADYFEVKLDLMLVDEIRKTGRLNDEIVSRLNPECTLADIEEDLVQIGWDKYSPVDVGMT